MSPDFWDGCGKEALTYLPGQGKMCLELHPVKLSPWLLPCPSRCGVQNMQGWVSSKMCPSPHAFTETWAEPAFFLRLLSDFQNVLVSLTHPKLCCLLFSILTSYLFKYIWVSLCHCGGLEEGRVSKCVHSFLMCKSQAYRACEFSEKKSA